MPRALNDRNVPLLGSTLLVLVALLVALLVSVGATGPVSTPPAAAATDRRPNIVVVMTDDMATADLRYMPLTRRLLGRAGVRFSDAVAGNPLCCPARASLLTGQESHNNGVLSNGGSRGGYGALQPAARLPVWLQGAGYLTGFLGKHLNGYRPDRTGEEPGWDVHAPILRGLYNYRSYIVWNDGGGKRVREYVTSYLSDRTRKIVRRFDRQDSRPFFLWVSNIAPHNAYRPSCRCNKDPIPMKSDRGDMEGVRSPSRKSPAYDHRNGADKPPFMRRLGRIDRAAVDKTFQARIESLKSVDRQVRRTVAALREQGELRRTVLVFTSDNGYMMGQHRFVGKRLPYQDSVEVPLLVRGPRVARGVVRDPVTTSDLAATVVDLAGATPTHVLDGVSFAAQLRDPGAAPARTGVVVQTGGNATYEGDTPAPGEFSDMDGWLHRGYRDRRFSYNRWPSKDGGEAHEELYDHRFDPAELTNLVGDPAYAATLREARERAADLRGCIGPGCHPDWAPLPAP